MSSKTEQQLLLELCLLKLRYSNADIERLANVREILADPALKAMISALRALEDTQRKAVTNASTKQKLQLQTVSNPNLVVRDFIRKLTTKSILRGRDQLDNFAQSIGVAGNFKDRQDLVRAVRERLENLPATQAAQKIALGSSHRAADSTAFVDLAKTLMRRN